MRRTFLVLVGSASLLGVGGVAPAGIITTIDQQNTIGGSFNDPIFTAAGQSFTPTLDRIDAAEFRFSSSSATLRLDLYDGSGISGALLGSSAPVVIATAGFETVHFDLLSPVSLTPGGTYTLFVRAVAGGFAQEFNTSNPYSGGNAFDQNGSGFTSVDLVFTEGLEGIAAVPEPSTLLSAMSAVGLLGCGWLRRRGARDAA